MRIVESMDLFIKEMSEKVSQRSIYKYKFVMELFSDYLANYAELSSEEDKDGNIILTADTTELHDGQVADFLEWFLIRKVIGPSWLNTSAPGILKKYFKWLFQKGLLDENSIGEITEVTKKASKDLPRVEKAASMFYNLCKFFRYKEVFDAKDYKEGYGEVVRISGDKIYVLFEADNKETGPIQVTKEIAQLLKKGDMVNLVVCRKGNIWYPIESGNVYPAE